MTYLVRVENLSVGYDARDRHAVILDGINLEVSKGSVLGVLGDSGSGKSTILRAILKMLPPNARVRGRVLYKDKDLLASNERGLSEIRGAKISMVYQDPIAAFDPVFTIGDQIAETIIRHRGVTQRAARLRARELLDLVQIPLAERRLQAFPHELSGGMRQRAMIALALSCSPDLLLADEPTSALDLTVQMQIILLLKELQKSLGMAIVLVTHDVGVAAELCDDVAVLYCGTVVERGKTEDVLLAPRHPYTLNLLEASLVGARRGMRLYAAAGMTADPFDLPPGCTFEPRCRFAAAVCGTRRPEEYIVQATHAHRCVRAASGEFSPSTPIAT
jgi:peptide/nickel transport system ATP-binding protein